MHNFGRFFLSRPKRFHAWIWNIEKVENSFTAAPNDGKAGRSVTEQLLPSYGELFLNAWHPKKLGTLLRRKFPEIAL